MRGIGKKHILIAVLGLVIVGSLTYAFKDSMKPKRPRLILLGLDGADWDVIDHFIIKGKLPTFDHLKREATWGRLQSLEPTLSPMLWTTIATGKRPSDHGIVDFLEWNDEKRERLPITSRHRNMPAIWNMLSHHGLKVGVFNWLVSWPAEKVNGVLVSDRLGFHIFPRIIGPRLTLEQVSYPSTYAEKKSKHFVELKDVTYEEVSNFIQLSKEEFIQQSALGQFDVQNPDMNLRLAIATFGTFKNFSFDYWKREDPDFMALYFDIPDTLMHTFVDFAPPKLDRVSLRNYQKYKNAVQATYEKIDGFLADLLEKMDEETHLIIVSDHGFKYGADRLSMPATIGKDNEVHWHDSEGIVLFWGKQFQKRKELLAMNLYDVVPTILKFFNLPIAHDLEGRIISSAFKPDYFRIEDVKFTKTYNDVPFGQYEVASVETARDENIDQIAKERLAALGYIDLEDEDNQQNRFQTRNPFLEAVQYQKAGRIDDAINLYKEILKNEPESKNALSIYNSMALIHRNKEKYHLAKKYMRMAIEIEPKLSSLYINLGNIEKQFGYMDRAFRAYLKAQKMDPADGMANYALGLWYEEKKNWAKAEAQFQKALDKKANVFQLPNRLMSLLEKQKKKMELRKVYDHYALESTPKVRFDFLMGENQRYLKQDRYNEALEALFEALRIQPKNAVLYNDIGSIFLKRNKKTKAISYFKRAISLDPGYAISYLNLASTYIESRKPKVALTFLDKVLMLDPKNKHAYFLQGLANLKMKQKRLAKYLFKKALELDPSFVAAKEHLKKVE